MSFFHTLHDRQKEIKTQSPCCGTIEETFIDWKVIAMDSRIQLITRADDCASSQTANVAIWDAYCHGLVRNVSVMVPCAYVEEAAKMFAEESDICIGLHATLNAEWDNVRWGPVLPPEQVPTLVNEDGTFFKTTQQLRDNAPNLDEVMAELQAQLDRGRELGFQFRYVDTHMVFEWVVPGMSERIDQWAAREGLLYYRHYGQLLPKVDTAGDPVEQLIARLDAAEPGQYLYVAHPAYDTEEMRRLGHDGYPGERVALEREWERLTFMDPRIIDYCRQHHVVPIRYDEAERLR